MVGVLLSLFLWGVLFCVDFVFAFRVLRCLGCFYLVGLCFCLGCLLIVLCVCGVDLMSALVWIDCLLCLYFLCLVFDCYLD